MTIHSPYKKQDINVRNSLTNFQKVTDFLSLTAFAAGILWQFLAFVIKYVGCFSHPVKNNGQSYDSPIKPKSSI